MVCSQEFMFIFENSIVSKSFAAIRKAISSARPDKEWSSKTIYRLVTFLDPGVRMWQVLIEGRNS
jgi:hypothetical protein